MNYFHVERLANICRYESTDNTPLREVLPRLLVVKDHLSHQQQKTREVWNMKAFANVSFFKSGTVAAESVINDRR